MKLKILVFRKKTLELLLFITLVIMLIAIFILLYSKPKFTQDVFISNLDKAIYYDFDGDGKNDLLYFKNNNSNYVIEIKMNNEIYPLECKKNLPLASKTNSSVSPNIKIFDISRDKKPEIFIQSSDDTKTLQHVFTFNNGTFDDIFCSNANILGFLDYKNNKTPKFVSASLTNSKLEIGFYMISNNKLQNYSFNPANLPGKNSIVQFISYLESLPYDEAYKPYVFFDNLSGDDLYPIGKISAECSAVKFLDGFFYDDKWNKDGSISEIKWVINLKGTLKGEGNLSKNYTLKITLTADPNQNNEFKISLLSF